MYNAVLLFTLSTCFKLKPHWNRELFMSLDSIISRFHQIYWILRIYNYHLSKSKHFWRQIKYALPSTNMVFLTMTKYHIAKLLSAHTRTQKLKQWNNTLPEISHILFANYMPIILLSTQLYIGYDLQYKYIPAIYSSRKLCL